jgi:hypothetical protein
MYVKKKADLSPRILAFFLEHFVGKPVEQVKDRVEPPFFIMQRPPPKDNGEDAEMVEG